MDPPHFHLVPIVINSCKFIVVKHRCFICWNYLQPSNKLHYLTFLASASLGNQRGFFFFCARHCCHNYPNRYEGSLSLLFSRTHRFLTSV